MEQNIFCQNSYKSVVAEWIKEANKENKWDRVGQTTDTLS